MVPRSYIVAFTKVYTHKIRLDDATIDCCVLVLALLILMIDFLTKSFLFSVKVVAVSSVLSYPPESRPSVVVVASFPR